MLLNENTLFSDQASRDDLIKDKEKLANRFWINLLGFASLYNIDYQDSRLKKYLHQDKVQLNAISDTNGDLTLIIKIAHEAGLINDSKANEITRFLALLKQGKFDKIDENVFRALLAKINTNLVKPSPLLKTLVDDFISAKSNLSNCAKMTFRFAKFMKICDEFQDLAKKMIPKIDDDVDNTQTIDSTVTQPDSKKSSKQVTVAPVVDTTLKVLTLADYLHQLHDITDYEEVAAFFVKIFDMTGDEIRKEISSINVTKLGYSATSPSIITAIFSNPKVSKFCKWYITGDQNTTLTQEKKDLISKYNIVPNQKLTQKQFNGIRKFLSSELMEVFEQKYYLQIFDPNDVSSLELLPQLFSGTNRTFVFDNLQIRTKFIAAAKKNPIYLIKLILASKDSIGSRAFCSDKDYSSSMNFSRSSSFTSMNHKYFLTQYVLRSYFSSDANAQIPQRLDDSNKKMLIDILNTFPDNKAILDDLKYYYQKNSNNLETRKIYKELGLLGKSGFTDDVSGKEYGPDESFIINEDFWEQLFNDLIFNKTGTLTTSDFEKLKFYSIWSKFGSLYDYLQDTDTDKDTILSFWKAFKSKYIDHYSGIDFSRIVRWVKHQNLFGFDYEAKDVEENIFNVLLKQNDKPLSLSSYEYNYPILEAQPILFKKLGELVLKKKDNYFTERNYLEENFAGFRYLKILTPEFLKDRFVSELNKDQIKLGSGIFTSKKSVNNLIEDGFFEENENDFVKFLSSPKDKIVAEYQSKADGNIINYILELCSKFPFKKQQSIDAIKVELIDLLKIRQPSYFITSFAKIKDVPKEILDVVYNSISDKKTQLANVFTGVTISEDEMESFQYKIFFEKWKTEFDYNYDLIEKWSLKKSSDYTSIKDNLEFICSAMSSQRCITFLSKLVNDDEKLKKIKNNIVELVDNYKTNTKQGPPRSIHLPDIVENPQDYSTEVKTIYLKSWRDKVARYWKEKEIRQDVEGNLSGLLVDIFEDKSAHKDLNEIIESLGKNNHVISKHLRDLVLVEPLVDQIIKSDALIKPEINPTKSDIKNLLKMNNFGITTKRIAKSSKESYTEFIERVKTLNNAFDPKDLELKVTPHEGDTPETLEKKSAELLKYYTPGKLHGNTGLLITNSYDCNLTFPEFDDFIKANPTPTVIPSFHGCGTAAASMILRFGFRIFNQNQGGPVTITGRMLGDGIYLGGFVDKSAQYVGDKGYSRQNGVVGYLFECETYLGKDGTNYKQAGAGGDNIRSVEYCVWDPRAQIKIIKAHRVVKVTRTKIEELYKKYFPTGVNESNTVFPAMYKQFKKYINEAKVEKKESMQNVLSFIFFDRRIPVSKTKWEDVEDFSKNYCNKNLTVTDCQFGYEVSMNVDIETNDVNFCPDLDEWITTDPEGTASIYLYFLEKLKK